MNDPFLKSWVISAVVGLIVALLLLFALGALVG